MTDTLIFVPYVPQGFEGPTVDVVDALKRGRAVLVEEAERWVRSSWFDNDHPEVDVQDPYCNSWKVCAEGAVLIVTVGLHNRALLDDPEGYCPWNSFVDFHSRGSNPDLVAALDREQADIYTRAVEVLRKTGERIYRREMGRNPHMRGFDTAYHYNDRYFETRDQVIAWFDEAIEATEAAQR